MTPTQISHIILFYMLLQALKVNTVVLGNPILMYKESWYSFQEGIHGHIIILSKPAQDMRKKFEHV